MTVNYDIQSSIERELDNIVLKYNPEGAWAIAMDPNSGQILGMSSRPNFNPNSYQEYDTETINRNMAIWASYEPGSTLRYLLLVRRLMRERLIYLRILFMTVVLLMLMELELSVGRREDTGRRLFLR